MELRASLLVSGLLFFISFTMGQGNGGPVVLKRPYLYNRPTENGVKDYKQQPSDGRQHLPWRAYSDREDNVTFTSPGGNTEKTKLKFLQMVWVIGEEGEYVRLATDEKFNGKDFYLTDSWTDCGWIHKKFMLLWDKCLVNSAKITQKAMLVHSIEAIMEDKENAKQIVFWKAPANQAKTDWESNLFQFYFIYKKTEQFTLLGRNDQIRDAAEVGSTIYGWVRNNQLNYWNTRNCLEINTKGNAVDERVTASVRSCVFKNETEAVAFRDNFKKDTSLYCEKSYNKVRPDGELRRFPLHDNLDNGLYRLTVYGHLTEEDFNETQRNRMRRVYNEDRAKDRNFNIVFVVDGTESMKDYFMPIAQAITQSVTSISSKNTVRWGAVVYRDFFEADYLTELQEMTSNTEKFNQFISGVFSDEKNKNDKDPPEAVFYGMREALQKLEIRKDETNIIVVVGDACNHNRPDKSRVKADEIQSLLVEKDAHLIVFQANNKGSDAYDNFVVEFRNLMLLTERQRFQAIKSEKLKPPVWKDMGNNMIRLDNAVRWNAVLACPKPMGSKGTSLDPQRLRYELQTLVSEIQKYKELDFAVKDKVLELGEGHKEVLASIKTNSKYTSSIDASFYYDLEVNYGLKPDDIKKLAQDNLEFSTVGFAPIRLKGFKYELFEPVIFLTQNELMQLVTNLSSLGSATSADNLRQAFYDSWIELLEQHTGDTDKKRLQKISLEDATEIVLGLPSRSEAIAGLNVLDITDPSRFQEDELQRWVQKITDKAKRLGNWVGSEYKYSFLSNDTRYYYILQTDLP